MDSNTILEKLKAPFPPNVLHFRVGARNADKTKGIALAYLNSRDVMKRLDDVLGIDGWQCKHIGYGQRVICELSCKIGGQWITKSDGAGETDVEGDKGAISDSLKRAAVLFGVGRYLYYLPNKWYELKNEKYISNTSDIIKDLPAWALPSEPKDEYESKNNELFNELREYGSRWVQQGSYAMEKHTGKELFGILTTLLDQAVTEYNSMEGNP